NLMQDWIENVWMKRNVDIEQNSSTIIEQKRSLLTLDVFKGHLTDKVKAKFNDKDLYYDNGGNNNDEPVNEFLDLRISNKSFMSINATLTATVEDQSNKIASFTLFELIVASKQQQLDHIIKIEELLHVISNKISEQETDIKSLKSQIGEAS
ncbi:19170_t:CDS:2, partial [Racocetra fulgida]